MELIKKHMYLLKIITGMMIGIFIEYKLQQYKDSFFTSSNAFNYTIIISNKKNFIIHNLSHNNHVENIIKECAIEQLKIFPSVW